MSNLGKKSKWNLSVFITNLSTEKSVEVNGETHVGKLMLDLVEGLGKCHNGTPGMNCEQPSSKELTRKSLILAG